MLWGCQISGTELAMPMIFLYNLEIKIKGAPLAVRRWWAELVAALIFNCPGGSQFSAQQGSAC